VNRAARAIAYDLPTLAVTSGEPAGIGPDICMALRGRRLGCRIVVLGDRSLFGRVRGQRKLASGLPAYDPAERPRQRMELLHVPLRVRCEPGSLDARNSGYVLELLDGAVDRCLAGEFHGMVTAPVHKGVINDAGIAFTGHTEYLAERSGAPLPVMMLVGGGLRVALVTTHRPLRTVSDAITAERLEAVLRIVDDGLRSRFGLRSPRIRVCGLNPHAGEAGHLGREEIDVIAPVIRRLQASGIRLTGPTPADTAFLPGHLATCDAVVAMYHDQGLPVLKHSSFGAAVNITLGLPIIRGSVDHGTALDLAGSTKADPGSLLAAIRLTREMCTR
jgi:4-hydroxythreonine-4-phosphate dehydrogenase